MPIGAATLSEKRALPLSSPKGIPGPRSIVVAPTGATGLRPCSGSSVKRFWWSAASWVRRPETIEAGGAGPEPVGSAATVTGVSVAAARVMDETGVAALRTPPGSDGGASAERLGASALAGGMTTTGSSLAAASSGPTAGVATSSGVVTMTSGGVTGAGTGTTSASGGVAGSAGASATGSGVVVAGGAVGSGATTGG